MSFIQRELDHIRTLLDTPERNPDYDRLYAAQQALSWALEPTGFAAPSMMITGQSTPEMPSPVGDKDDVATRLADGAGVGADVAPESTSAGMDAVGGRT